MPPILDGTLSAVKHISAGACPYAGDWPADGGLSGLNLGFTAASSPSTDTTHLSQPQISPCTGPYTRQDTSSAQRGIYRACQVIKL